MNKAKLLLGGNGILLFVRAIVVGLALYTPSFAQPTSDPIGSIMNNPDRFAWRLFAEINRDVANDPLGRVEWETWALARSVFANPNQAPIWDDASRLNRTLDTFDPKPLQLIVRDAGVENARRLGALGLRPLFDPAVGEGNETRMNKPTFDFIVNHNLFFIEGQETFFNDPERTTSGNKDKQIDFPPEAKEIKAQWRRIEPGRNHLYHTAEITIPSTGEKQMWGLTSLHITTKDIPNWFWATWEHKDNPDREIVIPSRDRIGVPDELRGTKWENYVLRGTQVEFTTSIGVPTVLASSQIENGFEATSSCITCHARATIGPRSEGTRASRLDVFRPDDQGFIGVPDPSWFQTLTTPPTRRFIQTDFVWSLFRARRRVVGPTSALRPEEVALRRTQVAPKNVAPHDALIQFELPQLTTELEQVRPLIHVGEARREFNVDGTGMTVAVLDTGLRVTHTDFTNRVLAQRNFTADNGNDPANANDGDGHGTNVTGIVLAGGNHQGIAPGARVIALKVLANDGGGSFAMIRQALQWVRDNRVLHNISVVNMSLGDGGNYDSASFVGDEIGDLIRELRNLRVAVVVASGNDFFTHQSQ